MSPLCAKLGVPIKLKRCQLSESQGFNRSAQILMLEPEPQDPEFGKSICDQLNGDFLVVRADGQNLGANSLQVLVKYVEEELAEMKSFYRTEHADPAAKAKEIAEGKVTKTAFDTYRGRRWGS